MESLRSQERKIKQDSAADGVDRISELPDELRHRILALIPTAEVVQLSLLSKIWRDTWRSVPSLLLLRSRDRFVEECLKRRLGDPQFVVTSLKLTASFSSGVCDALTKLLSSPAILSSIKELDLDSCYNSKYFPLEVLKSTSLNDLKVNSLALRGLDDRSVNLPSLRWLNLTFVRLNKKGLNRLLSGCPSLEKLELRFVHLRLNHLKISAPSLKSLEVAAIFVQKLSIHALNLQSLVMDMCSHKETDFSGCPAVRNLEIRQYKIDDDRRILGDIKHSFTLLECLRFRRCTMPQEFTISSQSLKSFIMHKEDDDVKLKATFETPNLESFYYEGELRFGLTMNSLNPLLNATFLSSGTRFSYSELMRFFSGLHWSCNVLTIDLRSHQLQLEAFFLMKDSDSYPMWPDLKRIKVKRCLLMDGKSEFKSELKSYEAMLERSSSFGKQMWKAICCIVEEYPNEKLSNKFWSLI